MFPSIAPGGHQLKDVVYRRPLLAPSPNLDLDRTDRRERKPTRKRRQGLLGSFLFRARLGPLLRTGLAGR